MLKHLKRGPFLTKEPALWMLEQIEEDFQGIESISKESIDAAFIEIKSLSPMLVRYRIVDNELYRYFIEDEPISLKDNSTEKAIKTLIQRVHFPDMDFIISYFDGYPFGPLPKAPILVSAKMKRAVNGILIPDARSIGHWWMSDIKSVKKAHVPWEEKKNFALWRGGFTKPIRRVLCQLSLKHPEVLDARFSSCAYDSEVQKLIENLMGKRASWKEFLSCKYLPYVDGVMCAAPALQWRLLSHSLTIKPDSDEIQWFYGALKPHVHYLPVKGDLSDLVEKLDWAKSHDDECRQIADKAYQFARENIMYGDVLHYFSLVLKRYGSCQNLCRKDLKEEMKKDPHWVKIQYRNSLEKQAKASGMAKFCSEGTPPM